MVNRKRLDSMFMLLNSLQGLFFFFLTVLSWVADWKFSAPVQTGPGAHPASCTMVTASLSQGVKRPGLGVDHPPTFSTKVNENSSPTHLTPSGLSRPVLGWHLPLTWILLVGFILHSLRFLSLSLPLSLPLPFLQHANMKSWYSRFALQIPITTRNYLAWHLVIQHSCSVARVDASRLRVEWVGVGGEQIIKHSVSVYVARERHRQHCHN